MKKVKSWKDGSCKGEAYDSGRGGAPAGRRRAFSRVGQPAHVAVQLETEGGRTQIVEMEREPGGYCHAQIKARRAGLLYRFQLDGNDYFYPDPSSGFQPEGPHSPCRLIVTNGFRWSGEG